MWAMPKRSWQRATQERNFWASMVQSSTGGGVDAVVAAIAPLAQGFPKVAELNLAATDGAFGIVNHLPQLLRAMRLLNLRYSSG